VGVGAAEAGRDDLSGIGLAVTVGVAEEEDVGRVRHPDAPVADRDAAMEELRRLLRKFITE